MFSNIPLLGTPNGRRGTKNSLEFTPIGKANVHVSTQNEATRTHRSSPLGPSQRLNQVKIHNKVADSSFDNSADNFSATINSIRVPRREEPAFTEAEAPNGASKMTTNLIAPGMTSIKEQQLEFQRIETENYNLKIKLATLTRYLDQTPEEQRALINQNIDMKQQLMEASREIQALQDKLHETAQRDARNWSQEDVDRKVDELKQRYVEKIKEKEWELEDTHNRYSKLEQQLAAELAEKAKVAPELLQQLEFLQNDNQKLRREIEHLSQDQDQLRDEADKYKSEWNALKQDMEEKEIHIGEMQRENQRWKDRYEALNNEYRGFTDANHGNLAGAKEEIIALRSDLDEFKYKYETTKQQLDKYRDEVHRYASAHDNGKNSNEKLSHQIDVLQSELKNKDKVESNLRSQIEALIRDKSGNEAYFSQIEILQESERKLTDINKKLRNEIAQLKDELFRSSSNTNHDSKILMLQREVSALKDKLNYYENQYELMEKAHTNSEADAQVLKDKLAKLNHKYHELEQDNLELSAQMKNADIVSNELDNINRQRLESEKSRLQAEVESLTIELSTLKRDQAERTQELEAEIKRLRRELELAQTTDDFDKLLFENRRMKKELDIALQSDESEYLRMEINKLKKELQKEMSRNEFRPSTAAPDRYLETEYQRALVEKTSLQAQLESTSAQLRELEMKNRKLAYAQEDKDALIDDLERKLNGLKRSKKVSAFEDEDEKTELLMMKANSDSKIRLLELEKQNLKKDYESEIDYYKNKVEVLTQKVRSDDSSIVALLEKQLEEAYKAKAEQSKQLSESMAHEEELKKKLESLQRELQVELESKAEENANLQDLVKETEKNEQLLQIQIAELELNYKRTQDELDKTTRHCTRLVDKLSGLSRQNAFKKGLENDKLQQRLDDLNRQLAQTSLTPVSSQKLNDQITYYRAKLYDMNLRANDLQTMYDFVVGSLKSNDKGVRSELEKLSGYGIYPDYKSTRGQKLTFAVVAKAVLAAVRIRRRLEKAQKRQKTVAELKSRIDL